jgi:hypothetical protein
MLDRRRRHITTAHVETRLRHHRHYWKLTQPAAASGAADQRRTADSPGRKQKQGTLLGSPPRDRGATVGCQAAAPATTGVRCDGAAASG